MSTGSVAAFVSNQPTQNITASTSNQTVTFNQCDALMLYNADASVVVFVALGTSVDTPTASVTTSVPVPPGAVMVLGCGGVSGIDSAPITKLAVIAASAPSKPLYITPGLGTQH